MVTYIAIRQCMNLFHGHIDVAYAITDDYRSTSDYAGGAIMWRSKKQNTITPSSTEAE